MPPAGEIVASNNLSAFEIEEPSVPQRLRGGGRSVPVVAVLGGAAALVTVGALGMAATRPSPEAKEMDREEVREEMNKHVTGTMQVKKLRPLGANKDTHGCLTSAGQSWCPATETCVRGWDESCPGGTKFCQEHCAELAANGDEVTDKACKCNSGKALDYAAADAVEDEQEMVEEPEDEVQDVDEDTEDEVPAVFGGAKDEHGCLSSAGLSWCPSLSSCVRGWEDSCPEGTLSCQEFCAELHGMSEEEKANVNERACTCEGSKALDHAAEAKTKKMFGGSKDAHGCLTSAGHSWCPATKTCVQAWSDSCPEGTEFCQEHCATLGDGEETDKACKCVGGKAHDYAAPKAKQSLGGAKDAHGCLTSAGQTWCPATETCVRGWSDSCPGGTKFCQEHCADLDDDELTDKACKCKDGNALDFVPPKPATRGGNKDMYGCATSAGMSWCPSSNSCVQGWKDSCPGGTQFCQDHCLKLSAMNDAEKEEVGKRSCSCNGSEALDFVPPKPKACCEAMTADCMACSEGLTLEA